MGTSTSIEVNRPAPKVFGYVTDPGSKRLKTHLHNDTGGQRRRRAKATLWRV
jgi:hypothetical protein